MSNKRASNLPPLASSGVFAVSSYIVIDAPRQKVWDVMTDLPSYTQWNPFVRSAKIVDKSKNPLEDQTVAAGKYLLLTVHMPPTMEQVRSPTTTLCHIEDIDADNYCAVWGAAGLPKFLLHTIRWQGLVEIDSGKTKYESIEVFSGLLAYIIKWFLRGKLTLGFKSMAEGLKSRSEAAP